jgi:ABC-type glycerol-3-phosphate transport system permease component
MVHVGRGDDGRVRPALRPRLRTAELGAASFLATIPLLIVFAFVGRRLVTGIMDGAFKG